MISFVVIHSCLCFSIVVHPSVRTRLGEGSLNYRAAFACLFFLLCFAFAAGVVSGQGTDLGTIRGIVTDTTGAIIPGAAVSVADALTSSARETRTNSQGNYEMFGLKPGSMGSGRMAAFSASRASRQPAPSSYCCKTPSLIVGRGAVRATSADGQTRRCR